MASSATTVRAGSEPHRVGKDTAAGRWLRWLQSASAVRSQRVSAHSRRRSPSAQPVGAAVGVQPIEQPSSAEHAITREQQQPSNSRCCCAATAPLAADVQPRSRHATQPSAQPVGAARRRSPSAQPSACSQLSSRHQPSTQSHGSSSSQATAAAPPPHPWQPTCNHAAGMPQPSAQPVGAAVGVQPEIATRNCNQKLQLERAHGGPGDDGSSRARAAP